MSTTTKTRWKYKDHAAEIAAMIESKKTFAEIGEHYGVERDSVKWATAQLRKAGYPMPDTQTTNCRVQRQRERLQGFIDRWNAGEALEVIAAETDTTAARLWYRIYKYGQTHDVFVKPRPRSNSADNSAIRAGVIKLWGEGHSMRQIAQKTGISRSAVSGLVRRLRAEGHVLPNRSSNPRRGRPPASQSERQSKDTSAPAVRGFKYGLRSSPAEKVTISRGDGTYLHMSARGFTDNRKLAYRGTKTQAAAVLKTLAANAGALRIDPARRVIDGIYT